MQWPTVQHSLEKNGMTVQDGLQWISDRLLQDRIHSPRTNAEQLLCWVLSCRRVDLHLQPDRELTHQQIGTLRQATEKRLTHTPLQYIIGSSQFLDFDLTVNEHVFIPRPETEILVEETIKRLRQVTSHHAQDVFIDLCTGCGNIAIALAREFPGARVYATDLSVKALCVARANALMHGLSHRISFLPGDLFEPVARLGLDQRVSAVVCNPPYVVASEIKDLPPEVRDYEPYLALDGGEDGLDVLRRIVTETPRYLKGGGLLALEVGQGQARSVRQFLIDAGWFQGVEVLRDLNTIERVVSSRKRGAETDNDRLHVL